MVLTTDPSAKMQPSSGSSVPRSMPEKRAINPMPTRNPDAKPRTFRDASLPPYEEGERRPEIKDKKVYRESQEATGGLSDTETEDASSDEIEVEEQTGSARHPQDGQEGPESPVASHAGHRGSTPPDNDEEAVEQGLNARTHPSPSPAAFSAFDEVPEFVLEPVTTHHQGPSSSAGRVVRLNASTKRRHAEEDEAPSGDEADDERQVTPTRLPKGKKMKHKARASFPRALQETESIEIITRRMRGVSLPPEAPQGSGMVQGSSNMNEMNLNIPLGQHHAPLPPQQSEDEVNTTPARHVQDHEDEAQVQDQLAPEHLPPVIEEEFNPRRDPGYMSVDEEDVEAVLPIVTPFVMPTRKEQGRDRAPIHRVRQKRNTRTRHRQAFYPWSKLASLPAEFNEQAQGAVFTYTYKSMCDAPMPIWQDPIHVQLITYHLRNGLPRPRPVAPPSAPQIPPRVLAPPFHWDIVLQRRSTADEDDRLNVEQYRVNALRTRHHEWPTRLPGQHTTGHLRRSSPSSLLPIRQWIRRQIHMRGDPRGSLEWHERRPHRLTRVRRIQNLAIGQDRIAQILERAGGAYDQRQILAAYEARVGDTFPQVGSMVARLAAAWWEIQAPRPVEHPVPARDEDEPASPSPVERIPEVEPDYRLGRNLITPVNDHGLLPAADVDGEVDDRAVDNFLHLPPGLEAHEAEHRVLRLRRRREIAQVEDELDSIDQSVNQAGPSSNSTSQVRRVKPVDNLEEEPLAKRKRSTASRQQTAPITPVRPVARTRRVVRRRLNPHSAGAALEECFGAAAAMARLFPHVQAVPILSPRPVRLINVVQEFDRPATQQEPIRWPSPIPVEPLRQIDERIERNLAEAFPIDNLVEDAMDTDSEGSRASTPISVMSDPPEYDQVPPLPMALVQARPAPVVSPPPYQAGRHGLRGRYAGGTPSPPPPINAQTDREVLIPAHFISDDEGEEVNDALERRMMPGGIRDLTPPYELSAPSHNIPRPPPLRMPGYFGQGTTADINEVHVLAEEVHVHETSSQDDMNATGRRRSVQTRRNNVRVARNTGATASAPRTRVYPEPVEVRLPFDAALDMEEGEEELPAYDIEQEMEDEDEGQEMAGQTSSGTLSAVRGWFSRLWYGA